MKHLFQSSLLLLISFFSCGQAREYSDIVDFSPADTLFRIPGNELYEFGDPCGFINQKGDTIHALGRFSMCFTDTLITYGIVVDSANPEAGLLAIDQKGNKLFDVYIFDNGPDWLSEGLFRIKRHGKIGYADATGKIIIEPQFECASQFSNGKAKVAYTCTLKDVDDEHRQMESDSWFFIDKDGNRID